MSDATATSSGWLPKIENASSRGDRLGFVVCWSQSEPDRLGEIILAPMGERLAVLGRGGPRPDDGAERLRLFRHRANTLSERPPLEASGISRKQLLVKNTGNSLDVERVGKLPVRVNGRVVEKASVKPGDRVFLEHQLLLLCVERTPEDLAMRGEEPVFGFGLPDPHGIVGESPRTWQLREQVEFYSRRAGHVLVLGPSGSGKELTARALHALSVRIKAPFIARNAATLPSGILDAELFGNARNYPNPGMRERVGLVGEADGGTLFLDELGELPEELQAHLLRLLDDGEYHRLGEERSRRVDLRFIGATNRDEGSLKHDLVARFKLRITVPGLNERREDIPLLIRSILRKIGREDVGMKERFFDKDEPRISPDLVDALVSHLYTTHVRELESLLLLAMAGSREHFVTLTPAVSERVNIVLGTVAPPTKEEIEAALERCGGSVSKAWKDLGLSSRDALNRLIKKHGIIVKRGDKE